MADLMDLYRNGVFSNSEQPKEEESKESQETPNTEEQKNDNQNGSDILKTIMEIELGRGFFNEYLDNLTRQLKSKMFKHLNPLYIPYRENEVASSSDELREKAEDTINKALLDRKNDFFKYLDSLNKLKNLDFDKE